MNTNHMLNGLLLVATFSIFQSAQAATQLGSSTISFFASGSPNGIAGTWSAPALDIQAGDTVEYFSLEILDVQSSFGVPIGIDFSSYFPGDSRSLGFGILCPNGISCVGQPTVGSISIVNVGTTNQPFALDFLFRLDPDNSQYTKSGQTIVNFSSGGYYATASGSVRVTAFGIAQAIPEADSYAMMLAGLGLVGFAARMRRG
jgi:hypothetical protein